MSLAACALVLAKPFSALSFSLLHGNAQAGEASRPARATLEDGAQAEVRQLEQTRLSLQQEQRTAEDLQRAASQQSTSRAEAGPDASFAICRLKWISQTVSPCPNLVLIFSLVSCPHSCFQTGKECCHGSA